MQPKRAFFCAAALLCMVCFATGARSFDDIFPGLSAERRAEAFTEDGIINSLEKGEALTLMPSPASGIDLPRRIMEKGYAYLTESLLVIPYKSRALTVLDAYNALGKVRSLKGRLYLSHTRKSEIPLFEEATRIKGTNRTGDAIGDPAPALSLPAKETVYIRLKDVNFGNSYYQADISTGSFGLLYSLTNFKSISYLFFPVMKEGKFSALLYLEPLDEGMLVYCTAGAEVSNFVANRIDIPSAIGKRVAVFVDWIIDGVKEQN
jgi:hypothetical protein